MSKTLFNANRRLVDLSEEDKSVYSASKLGYLQSIFVIAQNILSMIDDIEIDCVASVPHQHVGVLGNPAEEIGKCIARQLGKPFVSLRRDIVPGQSQYFYYTIAQRRELNNVAISADTSMFAGKRVALVDDLYASGSAMEVSTEKLLEAGAQTVHRYIDIYLTKSEYTQERPLDIHILASYRDGTSTILPKVVEGLNTAETIITKRLLEALFASGLTRSELYELLETLSADKRAELISCASRYFTTTHATLTVNPMSLL